MAKRARGGDRGAVTSPAAEDAFVDEWTERIARAAVQFGGAPARFRRYDGSLEVISDEPHCVTFAMDFGPAASCERKVLFRVPREGLHAFSRLIARLIAKAEQEGFVSESF